MHIVLVSLCEKRAWKKSRAILDSYALRSGERTWMTPITLEGLRELRSALRRQATRQTSVACFRNLGRSRMALLWVVGNRDGFGEDGISPVAFRKTKERKEFPSWARMASVLAGSAGLMHDLGKFGCVFQEKLKSPTPKADPVRHEWLSLILVRNFLKETRIPETFDEWKALWEKTWKAIGDAPEDKRFKALAPFDGPLTDPEHTLLYLIATHHRLPSGETGVIDEKNHVRQEKDVDLSSPYLLTPFSSPEREIFDEIGSQLKAIHILKQQHAPPEDPLYWKSVAWLARISLILSDHEVSSREPEEKDMPFLEKNLVAYANTKKQGKKRAYNQELNWHLVNVGQKASEMVGRILSLAPPSLSKEAIDEIQVRTTDKRYEWQNRAAQFLADSFRKNPGPHLVFNMAGTGSGKTRMNARAICALNEDSGHVRFATALNLRTLTLQTGNAYRRQLGIGEDEMACVIGDSLIKKLFDMAQNEKVLSETNDDENDSEEDFETETESEFEWSECPEWLNKFLARKPKMSSVIGAPVLVSTVDFLIDAGDPRKQGNHALASLRLMTSDLILDEIDSYDPKPMIAVLRLVWLVGLFGRNLVVSSATLSRPVARMIWTAYCSGNRARGLMDRRNPSFQSVLIDDQVSPSGIACREEGKFMEHYESHLSSMFGKIGALPYRRAFLQEVEGGDPQTNQKETTEAVSLHIKDAIMSSLRKLHEDHHVVDPKTGKKISFGLVRIANIRPTIEIASHIAETMPNSVRVACYHSQHPMIVRWHIEKRLDFLLSRQRGDGHIFSDPEIRHIIDSLPKTKENFAFVVVATPVEEIGRDHDFDWAIIEPSSTQSIVQTAGRVNRHRRLPLPIDSAKPNVSILQFNVKAMNRRNGAVFKRPGLEREDCLYETHDVKKLLDWEWLNENPLDARLRFDGRHCFPKFDDQSLEALTKGNIRVITEGRVLDDNGKDKMEWMSSDYYKRTALREKNASNDETFFYLKDPVNSNNTIILLENENNGINPMNPMTKIDRSVTVIKDEVRPSAWLSLSGKEMIELIEKYSIRKERGLEVHLSSRKNAEMKNIVRDLDFGFYLDRERD